MIQRTNRHSLRECYARYIADHALSPRSEDALELAANKVATYFERSPDVGELTEEAVNAWLASLELSPSTVRTYRGSLLTLLRYAAELGWCPMPITRRIRCPRKVRPLPRAWTLAELRRVLDVVDSLPGRLATCGRPMAAEYFGVLIRMAYETGLRRGNLFELRKADVSRDGTVYVRHKKTGQPHVCRIRPETAERFHGLPNDPPLFWRHASTYQKRWASICRAAGVDRGGLHRIRKTAATQVWLESGEDSEPVREFLGHRSGGMWRHYVDVSQGHRIPPQPPHL